MARKGNERLPRVVTFEEVELGRRAAGLDGVCLYSSSIHNGRVGGEYIGEASGSDVFWEDAAKRAAHVRALAGPTRRRSK